MAGLIPNILIINSPEKSGIAFIEHLCMRIIKRFICRKPTTIPLPPFLATVPDRLRRNEYPPSLRPSKQMGRYIYWYEDNNYRRTI